MIHVRRLACRHLRKFHRVNPYSGFDYTNYRPDYSGWDGDSPLFETLIDIVQPRVIVEVGTWKGESAFNMAKIALKHHSDAGVICVDTWLGSKEFWLDHHDYRYLGLDLNHGYPTVYYQFLANVMYQKLENHIVPLPLPSTLAHHVVRHNRVHVDMVYIDGDHSEDTVYNDIMAWHPFVKQHGLIFGHDWHNWIGVSNAVRRYCQEQNTTFSVAHNFWILESNVPGIKENFFISKELHV